MLTQEPRRILHFVGSMNIGGAETFIMNLYRNIDRSQVQFDFAVHTYDQGYFDEEIQDLGGRIYVLPSPGLPNFKDYQRSLRHLLEYCGPFHGVHSHIHFFSGIIMRLAHARQIPIRISHSHSTSDGYTTSLIRNIYRWIMRKELLKYSTHLFGCSTEACLELYGSSASEKYGQIIHNAIDLARFNNVKVKRQITRENLGLPLESIVIGHIGRLEKPKNHLFLLDVFHEFHLRHPSSHLVLVGDGSLKKEIQMKIHHLNLSNYVHLLGLRRDIPELLAAMDLILLPSLYEGLAIAVIEAQAAGIKSIVSDQVPNEVDLGFGLIHKVSLNESPVKWANIVHNALSYESTEWELIEARFIERNYEINALSKQIQVLYYS